MRLKTITAISLFIFFSFGFFSCSNMKTGIKLNKANFRQLNGYYSNLSENQVNITRKFFPDILTKESLRINIDVTNHKELKIKLLKNETLIDSINLYGKLRKGCFKVSKYHAEFEVPPIIWTLADNNTYLGLDQNKNLVIQSQNGGVMLFIFFPIFAANGGVSNYTLKRIHEINNPDKKQN